VAQKRGIAAFVIDGVIRDIAEIRELGFPVFARGVVAGPGKKEFVRELSRKIYCGGTAVPKIPHSAFAAIEMTTEKLWLNWNVINAHINSNMKNIGQ
jgi:Aldolase/RraA